MKHREKSTDGNEYQKGYRGFVVWLVLFCTALFAAALIPTENVNLLTLIVENVLTIGVAALTFVIYRNERIYWYTGLSFDEAKRAGTERRKAYARKHFKRFGYFALAYLVYSAAAYLLDLNIWLSIAVVLIGIVAVAISTVNIKLED